MVNLEFSIGINSPREKVWDIMLSPLTYKEWVNVSWPGSSYIGVWEQGENLRFVTADGSGTLATLQEYRPYEYILAKHVAVLLRGGMEDRESKMAKSWIGGTESYQFSGENGNTLLKVVLTINPEWASMFNDGWPQALAKLKEICEKSN